MSEGNKLKRKNRKSHYDNKLEGADLIGYIAKFRIDIALITFLGIRQESVTVPKICGVESKVK